MLLKIGKLVWFVFVCLKATKLKPQPYSMDMGFIWGLLGKGGEGARMGE